MSSWSLVTCRIGDSADVAAIRRENGSIVVPAALEPYQGLIAALADWPTLAPVLQTLDPDTLTPVSGAVLGAPVRYPTKLLCVGANYRAHLAEMGDATVPDGWQPFFFMVPPTTTLIGDGESIIIPADPAARIDWEAELAVVIGRGGRDIPESEALDHVAGYACFSDITARGLLRRRESLAEPFTWDWVGSKGLDTFCPMGSVTPTWMVADPGQLSVRCYVNGVLKQDGHTSDFISDLPTIIAAASRTCRLECGDIIATGTPAGVGAGRGEQLWPGDEVRVEVAGLATLTNRVVERPGPANHSHANHSHANHSHANHSHANHSGVKETR